jgi:hypothetical protein
MDQYILDHLSDSALLTNLTALVSRDRRSRATLLAYLAEVDARRLYAPVGYSSMFAFCVEELRFSEGSAARSIHAARAARRFPALFTAVAEGRLHITAVCLLAPHLTPENFEMLVEAAAGRRKSEIEEDLVRRFPFRAPKANDTAIIRPVAPRVPVEAAHSGEPSIFESGSTAMGHRDAPGETPIAPGSEGTEHTLAYAQIDPTRPCQDNPAEISFVGRQGTPEPRFLVRLTIRKRTRDKLREVQALLSHAVPSGDVAEVLDRALDALLTQLRKRKFGLAKRAPSRSGVARGSSPDSASHERSSRHGGVAVPR